MLLNPTQSRQLLQHALENQYAILAVNADSHAAVTDCLEVALQLNAPVIVETSLWQIKGHSYGNGDPVLGIARYLADLKVLADSERYVNVPVLYHTDHIKGPETMMILKAAIKGIPFSLGADAPFLRASTVSLDASDFSEEENINFMLELCRFADEMGVDVALEMESAVDDRITPPEETIKLIGSVEKEYPGKIALWAPGVGTQHGFTSDDGYSGFQPKVVENNVRLLKEITGRNIGIALHGSTGLSKEKLSEASRCGVVKVNWSSESLFTRSMAAKKYYENHEAQLDRKHKDWKNTAMDNGVSAFVSNLYQPVVRERMETLGCTGKASGFMANLKKS